MADAKTVTHPDNWCRPSAAWRCTARERPWATPSRLAPPPQCWRVSADDMMVSMTGSAAWGMAAAEAVAACPGREHSVQLSATKARMGHAEPAAGTVGIGNLMTMLEHGTAHPIMHLQQVRCSCTVLHAQSYLGI